MALLKSPAEAIKDPATFKTGWVVLLLLLVGFFVLEPLGIPVSAIAAVGALILFVVAKRGHAINTGKVLRGAPWQIVIFSLGMYLVVYGLRNAGLTEYLSGVLNVLADNGRWAANIRIDSLLANHEIHLLPEGIETIITTSEIAEQQQLNVQNIILVSEMITSDDMKNISIQLNRGLLKYYLSPDDVFFLNEDNPIDLLKKLTELGDIQHLYTSIVEREKMSSTNIGNLVAMPHPFFVPFI
ncbi:hypothetical protein ACS72_00085 [Acinetobacter sp. VT 511]|nr:hypothetical protein ACS72_00085 [Acinetobacter sp. VT 511]